MKKNQNFRLSLLASALAIVVLTGCSGDKKATTSAENSNIKYKEQFIGMGTSSSGGIFNTYGVAISQMLTQKIPGVKFAAQVTGGSGENSLKLGDKKLELALVAADTAYEASKGTGQFNGKQVGNIRVIGNLYPAVIQMTALKSAKINSYTDIKGKKINIGQAGSGSEASTISMLKTFGIELSDFTPQRLSHGNASDAVVDEKLDGYINIGGIGQSHQMKAMTTGKTVLVPMEPAEKRAQFLKEYPYYYEFTVPAKSYPNQEQPVNMVATGTLLVTRDDVSPELVYQITKQLFENAKDLEKTVSTAKELNLKDAVKTSGLPLHPGAEKYYKEVGALK